MLSKPKVPRLFRTTICCWAYSLTFDKQCDSALNPLMEVVAAVSAAATSSVISLNTAKAMGLSISRCDIVIPCSVRGSQAIHPVRFMLSQSLRAEEIVISASLHADLLRPIYPGPSIGNPTHSLYPTCAQNNHRLVPMKSTNTCALPNSAVWQSNHSSASTLQSGPSESELSGGSAWSDDTYVSLGNEFACMNFVEGPRDLQKNINRFHDASFRGHPGWEEEGEERPLPHGEAKSLPDGDLCTVPVAAGFDFQTHPGHKFWEWNQEQQRWHMKGKGLEDEDSWFPEELM